MWCVLKKWKFHKVVNSVATKILKTLTRMAHCEVSCEDGTAVGSVKMEVC